LEDGVVLLEIGGNDLLGSTSDEEFAVGLESLLQTVCRPGLQVVMFELPLPPFRNAYGRIQRRLAGQYGVALIPKRVLADIITQPGATLDSIHLSPLGHQHLADLVWPALAGAFR
jgi:acyl-CoA thioesterase-1